MGIKIRDLSPGDKVRVSWYPGQSPVNGTVIVPVVHASRASGTHVMLPSGQCMRIKASMQIEKVRDNWTPYPNGGVDDELARAAGEG